MDLIYKTVKLAMIFVMFYCNLGGIHCHAIPAGEMDENKSSILVELLNAAQSVLHSAKQYVKTNARPNVGSSSTHPMDCADIYENNAFPKSGIYSVWPRSRTVKGPIAVYCDMDDDGGAWTVIQRRGDFDSSKDYFYRDWLSYKKGFGDVGKDFWIGNDNIHALSNARANTIKFTLSDWEGNATYATYDNFWIDDEAHNYTMHVSGYRGTAGDSFSYANEAPFTSKDRDNDKHATSNCAVLFKAAWWYAACHSSNLNGQYLKGAHESYADGVEWSAFRGQNYSLKDTVMKIRPKDFKKEAKTSDMTPQ